jgi:branched-chain amino acid transport system substrate-binding protein
MKRGMIGIVCCLFVVSIPGLILAAEPYKVGAVMEVTGGASFLGEPIRNAFKMIEEQTNAAGGINGRPMELILYDTVGEPTKTVTAVKRLITNDKVLGILGPSTSGTALAVIPITEEAKIPHLALGASIKITQPPKKWVFATPQTDVNGVARIYDHLQKQGLSKVAIITVSNGFGDSGRQQLVDQAPQFKMTLVADEKFGEKDSDVTAQLNRIRGTEAQAIVCWTVGPTEAIVTKNWKHLAMKIPLYQSHGAASKRFLQMAGEAAEGIRFPAPKLIVVDKIADSDPQKRVLVKFRDDYEKRFKEEVSKFAGDGHDTMQIFLHALKSVGPDPAKIRDFVENLKGYVGITGTYNFSPSNHNGLSKDDFVMIEVKNMDWSLMK